MRKTHTISLAIFGPGGPQQAWDLVGCLWNLMLKSQNHRLLSYISDFYRILLLKSLLKALKFWNLVGKFSLLRTPRFGLHTTKKAKPAGAIIESRLCYHRFINPRFIHPLLYKEVPTSYYWASYRCASLSMSHLARDSYSVLIWH